MASKTHKRKECWPEKFLGNRERRGKACWSHSGVSVSEKAREREEEEMGEVTGFRATWKLRLSLYKSVKPAWQGQRGNEGSASVERCPLVLRIQRKQQ